MRWTVAGASVAGSAHIREGLPCQDSHAYRELPDGTLLIAVADGAGSAPHGGLGASLAVAAAIETLSGLLPVEIDAEGPLAVLTAGVNAARDRLFAEATERKLDLADLATTLLLVAASAE